MLWRDAMIDNDSSQRPTSYEDGQDIRDRSFEFACNVVGFCERLDEGKRVEGVPRIARVLVQEGNEVIAIVTAIIRNKRRNMAKKAGREEG